MHSLTIATRSSPLAIWQAKEVASLLEKAGFSTELYSLETQGDKKLDVSLSKIGEKGLFTQELEDLLLSGTAHLAVHSAKDMPSSLPEGLDLIAFSERENPCDVLVSMNPDLRISDSGIRIGTSSTRRVSMLKRYYPEAIPITIRGNLQTRFRKMEEGQCDAMLLAWAGVHRMGFSHLVTEKLTTSVFTPAAGQGSLAIEVSDSLPSEIREGIRAAINHSSSELALLAERAFLRKMEGGCSVPVFVLAELKGSILNIMGGVVSLDGVDEIRLEDSVEILPEAQRELAINLGERLGTTVLASGGSSILQKIKSNCD